MEYWLWILGGVVLVYIVYRASRIKSRSTGSDAGGSSNGFFFWGLGGDGGGDGGGDAGCGGGGCGGGC